jgi:hypothetical protein
MWAWTETGGWKAEHDGVISASKRVWVSGRHWLRYG